MSRITPEKIFLLVAQFVSALYSPFYLPVLAFVVLFMWSYLSLLSAGLKVWIILVVYAFTVLLPRVGIYVYRRVQGWTSREMSRKERRRVPYVMSIASYAALWWYLTAIHFPIFATRLVIAALVVQAVCVLLNHFHKVSTHAAASAAAVGALIGYSFIFLFNPIPWLCVSVLLCGLTCTARLILRQHTLMDVGLGVLAGFLSGLLCIMW